ncbi:Replication factor A protein 1 [Neolecta irregularis DAH-3]|uniref:Replication protein A subunit n=1 Tax=Neolecta irregularis (strain DAH-3) TaxID=1198029 RepID=A0A1U7LHU8_NEOID|nr:Replication factor A protein 1 [Neolecta irregularis DAH-3]|eukprot:OLL22101.1 Replication factor A protein 1 [Neolecta irregularis DAH-3]
MKERRILIVLNLEVLEDLGIQEKIGDPVVLEAAVGGQGQQQQQQAQQPVHQPRQVAPISNTNFYGNNKPAPQNQLQQTMKLAPSSTGGHAAAIYPIEGLSPYQNKWTIKARVTFKSEIKHWHNQRGEGKLFSVHLLDESGEIKATGFNDQCDSFYEVLQEGQVYFISKCRVNIAKKQFSNIQNEYELSFERDTEIEKCEDQSSVPQERYNFVELGNVSQIEKDNTIDVIGVVKEVHDLSEITSKTTQKPISKRDLTIVDSSQYSIRLTLWGKQAQNFSTDEGNVIAVKGVKVSDFNGRSLSMYSSSTMSVNPDIDEAHSLKGWYDGSGKSENFSTHANIGGSLSAASGRKEDRKTLAQLKDEGIGMSEQPDYFTTKATIVFIKQDNISYPACPAEACNKKVIEDSDGQWRCEKCDKSYPKPNHRYIMTISVNDHTGQAWFSTFDDVGKQIMGKTADELFQLKEENEQAYLDVINGATCTTFNFRCRAKQDNFQGQAWAYLVVLGATTINFTQASKELIELINAYGI